MNEKKCITLLKKGDRDAFNVLYKQYSKLLYFFSLKFVKCDDLAKEIVQEVFMKIWESRETLRDDTNFGSYLMTIAKNRIINDTRKELSKQEYTRHKINSKAHIDNNTENQIIYRDLFEATESIIEQLPTKRQIIFKLSRNQNMSNQEIADELQVSVRTVENHIYKALVFIKSHLRASEDNPEINPLKNKHN